MRPLENPGEWLVTCLSGLSFYLNRQPYLERSILYAADFIRLIYLRVCQGHPFRILVLKENVIFGPHPGRNWYGVLPQHPALSGTRRGRSGNFSVRQIYGRDEGANNNRRAATPGLEESCVNFCVFGLHRSTPLREIPYPSRISEYRESQQR
jgi:hypothetical protein